LKVHYTGHSPVRRSLRRSVRRVSSRKMALVSKSSCSRQTSENRLFFFRANWRSRSPVVFGYEFVVGLRPVGRRTKIHKPRST